MDKDLDIGDQHAVAMERPVLFSNIRTAVRDSGKKGTESPTLDENALWFAVAPLLVSMCVNGSQPCFYKWSPGSLPASYTRAPFRDWEEKYNWSIRDVTNLIEASIGAAAQASSWNSPINTNATIIFQATTKKLYQDRTLYLVVPVAIIALGQVSLLYLNMRMHHKEGLPIMRMAGFSELPKSALTDHFLDTTHNDHKPHEVSHLGEVKVSFAWTTLRSRDIAGLAERVLRFKPNIEDETALIR